MTIFDNEAHTEIDRIGAIVGFFSLAAGLVGVALASGVNWNLCASRGLRLELKRQKSAKTKAERDRVRSASGTVWSTSGSRATDEQGSINQEQLEAPRTSIAGSVAGKDYPEGEVGPQPPRIFWNTVEAYKPYFPEWIKRPEYSNWLQRRLK